MHDQAQDVTGGIVALVRETITDPWHPVAFVAGVWLVLAGGCSRDANSGPARSSTPPATIVPASFALASTRAKGHAPAIRDGGAPAGMPRQLLTLDVDGIRAEMRKARGHPLVVHLWATWCGPCLDELPTINKFAGLARGRGITVLSISVDHDDREIASVVTVLRARAPSLTAVVANFKNTDQLISLFSNSWEGTIPALFAFDATGKLQKSLIGEVDSITLNDLLAGLAPSGSPLPH